MKKLMNDNGLGVVEILLLILVAVVIGFVLGKLLFMFRFT